MTMTTAPRRGASRWMFVLGWVLAACDGGADVGTAGDGEEVVADGGAGDRGTTARLDLSTAPDQAAIVDAAPPEPQPTNNFAKVINGALRFSFTDASGAIACALVDDPATPLPYRGVQVYAAFGYFSYSVCPKGTYTLSPAAECAASFPVGKSCARYRLWDESATLQRETMATTGALVVDAEWVDSLWSRCTFDLELVFPGGVVFTRSFGVLYATDDSSLPDAC